MTYQEPEDERYGGYYLAKGGDWVGVPVANCRHGDDGPPKASWD